LWLSEREPTLPVERSKQPPARDQTRLATKLPITLATKLPITLATKLPIKQPTKPTAMSNPSFETLIASDTPTLIDFSAEWCGPCKMLAPVLKQLKQEMGQNLRILKIDVDKNPILAAKFRIQGVPTLMLFRNGNQLWRQSGLMPLAQLRAAVEQAMVPKG